MPMVYDESSGKVNRNRFTPESEENPWKRIKKPPEFNSKTKAKSPVSFGI